MPCSSCGGRCSDAASGIAEELRELRQDGVELVESNPIPLVKPVATRAGYDGSLIRYRPMTDTQSSLRLLLDDAAPYRKALEHHSLYQELTSLTRIRCFLEHHVFAVWDFMSLIKSLQRHLTRVEAPLLPVGDARIRRLINEVVLAEESDALPDGRVCSHFELYREAMQSAGADVAPVALFTEALERGLSAAQALRKARA